MAFVSIQTSHYQINQQMLYFAPHPTSQSQQKIIDNLILIHTNIKGHPA